MRWYSLSLNTAGVWNLLLHPLRPKSFQDSPKEELEAFLFAVSPLDSRFRGAQPFLLPSTRFPFDESWPGDDAVKKAAWWSRWWQPPVSLAVPSLPASCCHIFPAPESLSGSAGVNLPGQSPASCQLRPHGLASCCFSIPFCNSWQPHSSSLPVNLLKDCSVAFPVELMSPSACMQGGFACCDMSTQLS